MLDFGALMSRMAEIIFYICIGFIGRKTKVLSADSNRVLSSIIVNIGLPCLLLSSITGVAYDIAPKEILLFLGLGCLWQLLQVLVALPVAKMLEKEKSARRNYAFILAFGNVGIFGLPVIQPLFGSEGVLVAGLFNAAFNVMVYTLGRLLIQEGRISANQILKTLLSPGLLVGVLTPIMCMLQIRLPAPLVSAAGTVGSTTLPLLMFTVGNLLAGMNFREILAMPKVLCSVVLKLILVPVVLWLVFSLFTDDYLLLGVATVLGAMPVAGVATAMNVLYGSHEKEASTAVFVSTILSLGTIPLICLLLLR